MLWTSLIAGFTLGLAGSLHCIGMCGPLSLALPTWHLSKTKKFFSILLYQFGRVITYSSLGLLFGIAGRGFYMAGVQQWFSMTLGVLILISAVLYFVQRHAVHLSFLTSFYNSIQRWIGKILKSRPGVPGFLLLGIANGLLPCGMVYIALATTLSFIQLGQSVSFMTMFGLGTLPAMMLIAYSGQIIRPGVRIAFRKAVPYMIAIMGVMLILRGLNLGILFLSPQLPNGGSAHTVSCHW